MTLNAAAQEGWGDELALLRPMSTFARLATQPRRAT
jgi:hypothetical protein